MWRLTKIPNPIWYPGTGTQVQCCVAIVIPTVFHLRLDILDPYPYPYPWYPYPWSRTRTHTHIYGLVPIPVPVPMTSSHVVPVPIPVPMVSYPYPYPYPWSRTRTRTRTHGLVPIPVPVPMIRTHTTSLETPFETFWLFPENYRFLLSTLKLFPHIHLLKTVVWDVHHMNHLRTILQLSASFVCSSSWFHLS